MAARKSWCESNDPDFVAKAAEVVGLYLAPPEDALVICVDEKPSIQALERVAAYPARELHVILDNLNTHKKNGDWLARHPNVRFHFTPTRASWLNQVEIWFSILEGQSLRGASFASVAQLTAHIDAYNQRAHPFKATVRQKRFKAKRVSQL